MTQPPNTPVSRSSVALPGFPKEHLVSPRNVPLWMGLALVLATSALIVWQA